MNELSINFHDSFELDNDVELDALLNANGPTFDHGWESQIERDPSFSLDTEIWDRLLNLGYVDLDNDVFEAAKELFPDEIEDLKQWMLLVSHHIPRTRPVKDSKNIRTSAVFDMSINRKTERFAEVARKFALMKLNKFPIAIAETKYGPLLITHKLDRTKIRRLQSRTEFKLENDLITVNHGGFSSVAHDFVIDIQCGRFCEANQQIQFHVQKTTKSESKEGHQPDSNSRYVGFANLAEDEKIFLEQSIPDLVKKIFEKTKLAGRVRYFLEIVKDVSLGNYLFYITTKTGNQERDNCDFQGWHTDFETFQNDLEQVIANAKIQLECQIRKMCREFFIINDDEDDAPYIEAIKQFIGHQTGSYLQNPTLFWKVDELLDCLNTAYAFQVDLIEYLIGKLQGEDVSISEKSSHPTVDFLL